MAEKSWSAVYFSAWIDQTTSPFFTGFWLISLRGIRGDLFLSWKQLVNIFNCMGSLRGNVKWKCLLRKTLLQINGNRYHASLWAVRCQTPFQSAVRTIISSLQLLSFWKLSSSPSLNKFNRLTEFQPDAPCWFSKGPRWDNIMVCKARMEHFQSLIGENSNLSHKWQFSMILQSHTQKMWNSNKGMKQTHKRGLIPNATMLVWLLKKMSTLKSVVILKDMLQQ